jgi:general secretion pathway protein G
MPSGRGSGAGFGGRTCAFRRAGAGFTLLELLIVVAILGIVATIGVPQYASALRTARIGKSRHDLQTISHAIDTFSTSHSGALPLSLYQVGFGGKRDPWGVPYCYLNYADGTGDGLAWAVAAGLVDPSALRGASSGGTSPGTGSGTTLGGSIGGALARRLGLGARRRPQGADGTTRTAAAERLIAARATATTIADALSRTVAPGEIEALAEAIASSGGFAFFTGVPTETTRRRDRYMFPLNTDYDLFSLGPDTRTAVSLGETVGLDDVIRANNGGFFGPASEY